METHRDPQQIGWRSARQQTGELIDESADDDIESRHEDFIDAGHRVLIHQDAEVGGPRGYASLHDMRVEAKKIHLFRVLVLVVTAILAAYIYTTIYAAPLARPEAKDARPESRVLGVRRDGATTVDGRSLSGEEATVSILVYALLEAATRQANGGVAGGRR